VGFIVIYTDISDRKRAEKKMKHLALHDNLTDLANRYLFFDRLEQAISRAHRYHHVVAILYVDLDGFKSVNDTLGHDAGDIVLREVGKRLRKCIRKTDTAARLGGDEFAVVLPDLQERQFASIVADNIQKSLEHPINVNKHRFVIGASIGISVYPDDGQKPETLLRKADAAMYRVKKNAKNNFASHNSSDANDRIVSTGI
jgi:diguanylate cyclase (GGDEF)-like protein